VNLGIAGPLTFLDFLHALSHFAGLLGFAHAHSQTCRTSVDASRYANTSDDACIEQGLSEMEDSPRSATNALATLLRFAEDTFGKGKFPLLAQVLALALGACGGATLSGRRR